MSKPESISKLRVFLVLGRASNIPTVWSNCLAGCLLASSDRLSWSSFLLLCAAASLIYIGGMFLNDAFDASFDRKYRKERPIPSGLISARIVWISGISLLLFGLLLLGLFGLRTFVLGVALVGFVIIYDALHKRTNLSPFLMGACRVLLYLVAASILAPVNSLTLWSGVVLGFYIVGLSYVAKAESAPGPLRYWPLFFLGSPVLLSLVVNGGAFWPGGFLLSLLFVAWVSWSLRHLFWTPSKNIGAAVSGLLAGIVLVDLLAIGSLDLRIVISFLVLFILARSFQKVIPAT